MQDHNKSKVEELVEMLALSTEVISDDYGRVLNKGVVFFNVRGAVRRLRSMGYKITIKYSSSADWTVRSQEPKFVFVKALAIIQELKTKK